MGKVKKAGKKDKAESKAAAKEAKKAKQGKKLDKQEKKKLGKEKEDDDFDFIRTLAEERERWAAEHQVTESIIGGPPSRRANASLTACPVKDHLYLFGGEYYDGTTVEIYPDLFRYDPGKNEWRQFTSPTSPGPRSAHQVVASPAGGGKLWLFGGEYSAPNQSSFHHYRDLWCFDIPTHSWERFDTKTRPSARSGHRMAMWKQYMFLFGGFQDVGVRTSYLSDLWVWDTLNYKWYQIEHSAVDRKPGARSGHSFLPCPEGLILHGGYTKTYEGKRVTGMALSDTWLLRLPPPNEAGEIDFRASKWEKRKGCNVGYAPSPRSGCTMALWQAKGMGVLFGGVFDDDKDEETLESVFYNQLFGYNMAGRDGRWISLPLKRKKKMGGKRKKKVAAPVVEAPKPDEKEDDEDKMDQDGGDEDEDVEMAEGQAKPWEVAKARAEAAALAEDDDPDDPEKTIPMARYNTMLAIQRNTLYLYGGILENGPKEFTLDDFYTLQLDKLDRFNCLKECPITSNEWNGSDSEGDDDSDDEDEDDDDKKSRSGSDASDDDDDGLAGDASMKDVELADLNLLTDAELAAREAAKANAEREELRKRATAFMGVSTSTDRSAEDILSTPQPGESLAQFFARSREFWTQKAHANATGNRGKELRRDGFTLAEEAFKEYQPLLEEIARIQAAAGLEAEELARGARAGLGTDSRNRR